MSFDKGTIVLNNNEGVYYSGQRFFGKLIFDQQSNISFRGIYIQLKGYCHVKWTKNDYRHREIFESHEEYVKQKIYLIGSEEGDETITPGRYEYPFVFELPSDCPSSFQGQYGHVRYHIKAVMDRSFKFNKKIQTAIQVIAPLDLNLEPRTREPVTMSLDKTYKCFWALKGTVAAKVKLPHTGFVPGYGVPIQVAVLNSGSVDIQSIVFSIVKKLFLGNGQPVLCTFVDLEKARTILHDAAPMIIAGGVTGPLRNIKFYAKGDWSEKSRSLSQTIAEFTLPMVPSNTNKNYTVSPPIINIEDAPNMRNCRYIDVDYGFQVILMPAGCHLPSIAEHKIVIGTVPLRGSVYSSTVQTQLPVLDAPVVSQPLPFPRPEAFHSPRVLGNPYEYAAASAPPLDDASDFRDEEKKVCMKRDTDND